LAGIKYIKLFGIIVATIVINVIIFSPGMIGVAIGESAFASAFGITLILASILALLYGSYSVFFKQPVALPVKEIVTHEDYVEALLPFTRVGSLEGDVGFTLDQMERLIRKKDTLMNVLGQRFESTELSYKKFASVIREVEKLFYLNIRSMINRLRVFDEAEFKSVMSQKVSRFSTDIMQEKAKLYNEFLSFMKHSLDTNEEILLKLDKLLLEISRLDSFDPAEIENMPCMREIDSLIKQTKYYKQ